MEPVTYEQIIRELAVKRGLKPWEVPMSQEAPPAAAPAAPMAPPGGGTMPDEAMALAQKRAGINQVVGQMGNLANPETAMAQQGRAPNAGLINLLMSLIR